MPKKKMQVTLKPLALNIEKTIKTLSGFQKKVSPADSAAIDLKIESLNCALERCESSLRRQEDDAGLPA